MLGGSRPFEHIVTAKKQTSDAFSLVYLSPTSVAHEAGPVGDDVTQSMLADIQKTAQTYNSKRGIRGVLLYAAGHFTQWLAGIEATVRPLRARIETDPRREEVQVIYVGMGPAQLS